MDYQRSTAAVASAGIRIVSFFFLRWVNLPSILTEALFAVKEQHSAHTSVSTQPLVYITFALFAIYVPAFVSTLRTEPKVQLVEEIEVTVKEKILNADEVASGEAETVIEDGEVQIRDEISFVEKPVAPLKTLLTGLPSPNSLLFTSLTFLINVACILMVSDAVWSPRLLYPSHELSFARIGYVSSSEAKLLIREPDQSKMPIIVQIRVKDPEALFENPLWHTAGGVRWTTEDTDYTAVVSIPVPHPRQKFYEWTTSNNHSGEFVSAPRPGQAPTLFDGKFTFLSTSCILPRLPYSPFDHPLAIPGMKYLAKVLPTLNAQFMLFLGDFIYIDVPSRFGASVEDYRQKYRQVYSSPDWPAVGQNLSWIHVLDDHEILNDWDNKTEGVYEAALDPYRHYQTASNPPGARTSGNATYFSFAQGPASFFMWDTRSYRSKNSEPFDSPDKTMLGQGQLEDFLDWIRRPEKKGIKWKIIASSVPLTKNWKVNIRDTWGGFLHERRQVLEAMWDAGLRGYGVVVLSGDRHEFGATAFPPPKDGRWPESVTVHEFSASPLNQFYSPIPSYRQTDDEDIKLKYINTGNSKFGALTIETLADGHQSSLKYTLYVDGAETWDKVILAPELEASNKPTGFWDRIRGGA